MAVRQYVGARYVPKFADPVTWQSGTSYEALTIVTYNNASYTSKVPVPATVGNPADNPTYWVITGNYNTQVEAYREETVAVQKNLSEEVTNREAADTALGERITEETTARTSTDEGLQDSIDTLNETVLYLGNSYAISGLYDLTKNLFGKTYLKAGSGTGFYAYNTEHEGDTWQDQLQKAIDDTSIDNNEITRIVIIGAAGDSRSAAVLCKTTEGLYSGFTAPFYNMIQTKANDLYTLATTNFPNCKRIQYVWCESRYLYINTGIVSNDRCYNAYIVHKCMSSILPRCGIEYLGWAAWPIFGEQSYMSDQTHPNTNGYKAIATNVRKLLKGGGMNYVPKISTNAVDFSNVIEGLHIKMSCLQTPEYMELTANFSTSSNIPATYTYSNNTVEVDAFATLTGILPSAITMPNYAEDNRDVLSFFPSIRLVENMMQMMVTVGVNSSNKPVLNVLNYKALSGTKADITFSDIDNAQFHHIYY